MTNMNGKTLVHIGMPKTGSTTLQQLLFQEHPQICEFVQPQFKYGDTRTILRAILDRQWYPPYPPHQIWGQRKEYRSFVVSDEALTFGEFMRRGTYYWDIKSDHYDIAERIKYYLGDVHIMVVLRNQADLLSSYYQYTKSRMMRDQKLFVDDIESFEEFIQRNNRESEGRFFTSLDYTALINAYEHTFGTENVHVFIFETYKKNLYQIGDWIGEFFDLGNEVGKEYIGQQVTNQRKDRVGVDTPISQFIKQIPGYYSREKILPKASRQRVARFIQYNEPLPSVSEETRESLRQQFAESNKCLFERLQEYDGEELGYW